MQHVAGVNGAFGSRFRVFRTGDARQYLIILILPNGADTSTTVPARPRRRSR